MKRFKRHLCDHLFLRTGGYLDRHGDKPGLALVQVCAAGCFVWIRTSREIVGVYLFFYKFLIFQESFFEKRPKDVSPKALRSWQKFEPPKVVRQQNNDEMEQRTRWNELEAKCVHS